MQSKLRICLALTVLLVIAYWIYIAVFSAPTFHPAFAEILQTGSTDRISGTNQTKDTNPIEHAATGTVNRIGGNTNKAASHTAGNEKERELQWTNTEIQYFHIKVEELKSKLFTLQKKVQLSLNQDLTQEFQQLRSKVSVLEEKLQFKESGSVTQIQPLENLSKKSESREHAKYPKHSYHTEGQVLFSTGKPGQGLTSTESVIQSGNSVNDTQILSNGNMTLETANAQTVRFSSHFIVNPALEGQTTASYRNVSVKVIYSPNLPYWQGTDFTGCNTDACVITKDPNLREKADAVLVHVVEIGGLSPPPSRPRHQIWIAFGMEPPMNYNGGYRNPLWRSAFNWTMTYRLDSEVFWPYAYLVYRPKPPVRDYDVIWKGKTKMVAWLVGKCHTQSLRQQYVTELKKYIDVDVYGACGPLKCSRQEEAKCMSMLNTTYRFYLSFENSLCRDYVTEKLLKLFADVQVIPVVRGGADYKKYFPPGTFISTADFQTPRHLADYLKQLAANRETFTAMLREKDRYVWETGHQRRPCDLCAKLHQNNPAKIYSDFPEWLTGDGVCRTPTDLTFNSTTL